MKWFKRILLVLFLLLLVISITVWTLFSFYKQELEARIIDEVKQKFGLNLQIENITISLIQNWPQASVNLKMVQVSGSENHKANAVFLRAGSVAVTFNLRKLLQKQIVIRHIALDDVDLNLIRYADGSSNFEIKSQQNQNGKSSTIEWNLDKIHLKDVNFKFNNEQRNQVISFRFINDVIRLKNYEEGIRASLVGKVFIKGLLFNERAGELLHETTVDLNLESLYLYKEKTVTLIPPSFTEIEGHRYRLSSIINLNELKTLSLVIQSENVIAGTVARYLTPKLRKVLSNFKLSKTVDARFILCIHLGVKEEPIMIAEVIGKNCQLQIGNSGFLYTDLYFKANLISLHTSRKHGDMDQARMVFKDVKGKVNNFPFTATVKILHLRQPFLDLEASLVVDGKNKKTDKSDNFALKGTALIGLHYSGNARNLNKEKFLSDSMRLKAYLLLNDLSYRSNEDQVEYIINGKSSLDKSGMSFDKLQVKSLIGNFMLKGKVMNVIQFAMGMTKELKANIDMRSDLVDINPLLMNKNKKSKVAPKQRNKKNVWEKSVLDVQMNVLADRLLIRKVETRNAQITFHYKNGIFDISHFFVHTCDGEIKASGKITDLKKIEAKVNMKEVDAKKLFEQFENFGQDAIKSENLKGKVFVDAGLSAELDENNEFKGETMKADAHVILKDGHLINYEPLQGISNFVMKQKDLRDVTFSEIDESFKVRGFEMKIDELEIASSVVNLYIVNGLYSMKGHSNINMLIPWSNLKRLGMSMAPKGSGESAANTKGLKLNYSGTKQKMKLSFGHHEQEKRFW